MKCANLSFRGAEGRRRILQKTLNQPSPRVQARFFAADAAQDDKMKKPRANFGDGLKLADYEKIPTIV